MKKVIYTIIFALVFTLSFPLVSDFAGTQASVVFAGTHKKHKHYKKRTSGKKTVHVKGYTTKKGKHVHSYKRSKPHRK